MSEPKECRHGGETRSNGNCTNPDPDDGLPVQCVGSWATDKHHYLRNYIEATRSVRKRYVSGEPGRNGGAAFVDLFAGPGRARVRDSGDIIDGSPLIALAHDHAPFTSVVLCELDDENADTLRQRTAAHSNRVCVLHGDCNDVVDDALRVIPEHGLNIALVDPFGLSPLRFETLSKLAAIKRMDFLLHFPTSTIKRNFQHNSLKRDIDRFLGTDVWRERMGEGLKISVLIQVLREQLAAFGYDTNDVLRSVPIKNNQRGVLYHLVFASKHDRGGKIWNSITKNEPSGQKSLF